MWQPRCAFGLRDQQFTAMKCEPQRRPVALGGRGDQGLVFAWHFLILSLTCGARFCAYDTKTEQ
jgi:hypothetical protein